MVEGLAAGSLVRQTSQLTACAARNAGPTQDGDPDADDCGPLPMSASPASTSPRCRRVTPTLMTVAPTKKHALAGRLLLCQVGLRRRSGAALAGRAGLPGWGASSR